MDSQYLKSESTLSQRQHHYGRGVTLIDDPYLMTLTAQLSSAKVVQPRFNELVAEIYRGLFQIVANHYLKRKVVSIPTRMQATTPKGVFTGELIDPEQSLVLIDLARAGIVPTNEGLNFFSKILNPARVRIDHIFVSRTVDESIHQVTGAAIAGAKIGGSVEEALVIIPDPMGATGSTALQTISTYQKTVPGKPAKILLLHLIAAPEAVRRVHEKHPEVDIMTIRLDRGLSSEAVLQSVPGSPGQVEVGLNDHQYIVPGAGGVGELMNNSFV